MKILIVGGGIGGLTASRLLAQAGHRVVLMEQSPTPRAVGAGIVLPADVVATLEHAGVVLEGLGQRLTGLAITTAAGRPRATVRQRVSFSRPQLLAALSAGLGRTVDLRYGTAVERVWNEGGRARSRAGGREEAFDLVVGADGLRSCVRAAVPASAALRYCGQVAWRGIVDGARGDAATEMWNGSERIGVVPLIDQRTYVYVVRLAGAGSEGELTTISDLAAREAWALDAMQHLPPHELLRHELWEVDRPSWGDGRIVLLGDAAHAVTPNLGLGAAMAVQDASALTSVIGSAADPLAAYRRLRGARVRRTQLASRALGRLAHDESAPATTLRRVLSLQSRRRIRATG